MVVGNGSRDDGIGKHNHTYGLSVKTPLSQDESQPLLPSKNGPPPILCSARYTVSFLAMIGITCAFMSRVNIGVAMIAMANSTYSTTYDTFNTSAEICPDRSQSNETNRDDQTGEFPWDSSTQEQILGAFYYGFPIVMIPSGLIGDRYPRACPWIFGVGYLGSAVCTLFIPWAAYQGGAGAIIALRVIAGISESGSYPCMYSLMSRWAPPADRATLLAIVFSGSSFGQIIAQPISGVLSASNFLGGWPPTFYLLGSLGVLWAIFWLLLVYPTPMSHPRISEEERNYIVSELRLNKRLVPKKYPWSRFFTSLPLFAVIVADFASMWILYSLTANLPIYLSEALRFDISQTGILSSVPYILLFFFIVGGGYLADFLLSHTKFGITAIRKIMTSIGLLPSGLFLAAAGYVGCSAPLAITFISLGLAFSGFAYSGSSLCMMEFAAPYAGLVVAIANTFATIPGFVSPIVVAHFTENQADLQGWRSFYWVSCGIAIIGWAVFVVFGTSELQSWAKRDDSDDDDDDNDDVASVDDSRHDVTSNGIDYTNERK